MNKKTSDSGLSSSTSIPYLPKPVRIPCSRASSRRVWMRAHWGKVKLQVPCRGSGNAGGGDGGHGFFVHSVVWMQMETCSLKAFLCLGMGHSSLDHLC